MAKVKAVKPKTREEWLELAAAELKPLFKRAGNPVPDNIRITVSFPWQGSKGNAIGQHFPVMYSKEGYHEMLIHPKLDDNYKVIGTLCHELVHASLPEDAGHGPLFKKLGLAVGLSGKPKYMGENDTFNEEVSDHIIAKLGNYPHAAFDYRNGVKRQTTRLLKCECKECGYIARVTATWIDNLGTPICPGCEQPMETA